MKIGIVGAGNIGANIAYGLICSNFADKISEISLVDIIENLALGKALDLAHASSVFDKDIAVRGGGDYALLKDSDIVVITAGATRKAGQSREDLLKINANIVAGISEKIAKFAPNSVIIMVTNPLDIMVFVALNASGFPKNRVLGMAGELDSARLKHEITRAKNAKNSQVRAFVVGFHSDEMHILENEIYINGEKAKFDKSEFEQISQNTTSGGAKITNLLGSSAYFAPSCGVVKMTKAMILQTDETLICSVFGDDEVPCGKFVKLDKFGVKEVIKFNYPQNFTENFTYFKNKISELKIEKNIKK